MITVDLYLLPVFKGIRKIHCREGWHVYSLQDNKMNYSQESGECNR